MDSDDRCQRWTSEALYAFLAEQGVAYERIDHPAVSPRTKPSGWCRGAGARAENLLVEDRKDGQLFMLHRAVRKAHRPRGHGKVAGRRASCASRRLKQCRKRWA